MATCCAPACSQALPVKPEVIWARGSEAWAGSRDLRNLEFVRWGSSGPSSLMICILFLISDCISYIGMLCHKQVQGQGQVNNIHSIRGL